MIKDQLKLCLVTNPQTKNFSRYQKFIVSAVEGGVTLIQLRDKSKNLIKIRRMAFVLKNILAPFNVPLIINDYIELAKEIDADGVHLGQSDYSPTTARQLLGPNKIIGWSIETLEQLEIANHLSCIDYIAASAVFPSLTKTNCKTIWGLNGLQQITSKSKHPVVAIGGINEQNIANVIEHGANGVAVINAIHCQNDPKKAAFDLITAINKSIERKKYV